MPTEQPTTTEVPTEQLAGTCAERAPNRWGNRKHSWSELQSFSRTKTFRIVSTEPYGTKFTAFAWACDVCHKSQKLQEPLTYSGPGDYMLSCIACDAKLCEKCYKEELHFRAHLRSWYDL